MGKKPEQHTWTWCPWCHVELTKHGDVVRDNETVVYCCPGCGSVTEWLFDTPVPIYLRTLTGKEEELEVKVVVRVEAFGVPGGRSLGVVVKTKNIKEASHLKWTIAILCFQMAEDALAYLSMEEKRGESSQA